MKAKIIAFVAVMTVTGLLGGCTAARNGLGTHDSACFRVYPEAVAAVHRHGHFAGERYLAPRALIIGLHDVVVPDALQDASRVATCLVAFTGRFTVTDVSSGWAPSGRRARSPSSSSVNATWSCLRPWCSSGSRPGSSSPECSRGCDSHPKLGWRSAL